MSYRDNGRRKLGAMNLNRVLLFPCEIWYERKKRDEDVNERKMSPFFKIGEIYVNRNDSIKKKERKKTLRREKGKLLVQNS